MGPFPIPVPGAYEDQLQAQKETIVQTVHSVLKDI
jgi:hypothetical protein